MNTNKVRLYPKEILRRNFQLPPDFDRVLEVLNRETQGGVVLTPEGVGGVGLPFALVIKGEEQPFEEYVSLFEKIWAEESLRLKIIDTVEKLKNLEKVSIVDKNKQGAGASPKHSSSSRQTKKARRSSTDEVDVSKTAEPDPSSNQSKEDLKRLLQKTLKEIEDLAQAAQTALDRIAEINESLDLFAVKSSVESSVLQTFGTKVTNWFQHIGFINDRLAQIEEKLAKMEEIQQNKISALESEIEKIWVILRRIQKAVESK